MNENKICKVDIICDTIHKNDSKLPICYLCEGKIPLTKDNFINRVSCGGNVGGKYNLYWHKKCFKKANGFIYKLPIYFKELIKIDL